MARLLGSSSTDDDLGANRLPLSSINSRLLAKLAVFPPLNQATLGYR